MAEMQFDFDGLIKLLAGNLYSEKKVFIRELVQNAHDAIQRRAAADRDFTAAGTGRIDIITEPNHSPGRIIFRDNGTGMTKKDLEGYLSSIGSSGTRVARDEGNVPDVIGQFGIGFLSGFIVASRVEVRTRHYREPDASQGWLWQNDGSKHYTLEPCEVEKPGTEVIVYLESATDRGLIQKDAVEEVVRTYADMLKVAIHLNGSRESINTRTMPWERVGLTGQEFDLDCLMYLEKVVPDHVLEVIPVNLEGDLRATGLLYVTKTRVLGTDQPRTIRLFQRRMFVCENTPEILPSWATFVNGIINSPDLTPNAARDNFIKDNAYQELREKLGLCVIEHFEQLREENPRRLSEILAYHVIAIKAACYYHNTFFDKFGHLLEWRVNGGSPAAADTDSLGRSVPREREDQGESAWVTLPQIVKALPQPKDGGLKQLRCFTSTSSANQYFEMANAAGTTVIDASYPFEANLLARWVDKHVDEVRLSYLDREDDPDVFRDIDPEIDAAVKQLANEMSLIVKPLNAGGVQVEARRFEPHTLSAILKSNEAFEGRSKARDILNDPNTPADLRQMAQDMMKMSRNANQRMTINASNGLIRSLAVALQKLGSEDPDVRELMMGVYNDAVLFNQEMMTPANARTFHEQFGRLMSRCLDLVTERSEIAGSLAQQGIERQRQAEKASRDYMVACLAAPDDEEFASVREGVRVGVENQLGCELVTVKLDGKLAVADYVDADFLIADGTGADPKVMMALGAILAQAPLPLVLISQDGNGLPYPYDKVSEVSYKPGASTAEIGNAVVEGIHSNSSLGPRFRPVEAEWLAEVLGKDGLGDVIEMETCTQLTLHYSTVAAWEGASVEDLEGILGSNREIAERVLRSIQKALKDG